uniref:Lipase n=1 Tax=Plectus sambesii TaxID=2011161 RepID=A0A914WRI2_9BILA
MSSHVVAVLVLVTVAGSDGILNLLNLPILNPLLDLLLPLQLSSNDPEIFMSTPEIIERWGYPVQTVQTNTTDGYILTMHRIPYGKAFVFFQHGLLCSSSDWIINLPNQSAGFMFADAGFDVWLGNMRGNTYSKAHTTLNTSSHQFWEFTWDDMMRHDLDAMIDKVLAMTGQSALYYVGHSQGTLTMFTKLSIDQLFAKKIKKFFALAPVVKLKNIKGLLRAVGDINPLLSLYYNNFGQDEFLPSSAFLDLAAQYGCGLETNLNPICKLVMFSIGGPDTRQFNSSRVPVIISQTPAGTSSTNFIHLGQMVTSGKHEGYNWGSDAKNIQHYNSTLIPIYNISTVNVPTYLFTGDKDWLANPTDVQYIRSNLSSEIVILDQRLLGYNHYDFTWGLKAADDIYKPIIKIIYD